MRARQAFAALRRRLAAAGVPQADLDAAALVERQAGPGWRWQDPELDPATLAGLEAMAARRERREPLQYILGRWPFLDLELAVGPGVLCPRQDTETLCLCAARLLAGRPAPRVLDLCAGSGCVGLGVKRLVPAARVTMAENSPAAFGWLQKNAASALPGFDGAHPAAGCVLADVFRYQGSLLPGSYDLIVSNPPYVTDGEMAHLDPELAFEPGQALAAGPDGLRFYRHILPGYLAALAPGGFLAVEIGWRQAAVVTDLFAAAGYRRVTVERDAGGRDRVVWGQRP